MPLSLDFNYDTRVITVLSPDIQADIQTLVNLISTEKATRLSMDDIQFIGASGSDPIAGQDIGYKSIAIWSGKSSLGGGTKFTEIVLTLLDWKLDFQEFAVSGPLEALITGGSLLAVDVSGVGVNPIVSTVNVATIAQAVSGTLIETTANKQLQFAIESNSQRSKGFKATGEVYYVDPINGDDGNDGRLPERLSVGSLRGPKLTFASAYALTISARHDVIYLIQSQVGADTVLNENILMDKDDVHLRGQGKGLVLRPTNPNIPTIQITGAHVGVRDFRVQGLTGSAVAVFECIGPEPNLDRINIENGDGHGLLIRTTANDFEVVDVFSHDHAGSAVRVESAPEGSIMRGRFHSCVNGIHLQGSSTGHAIVDDAVVYNNSSKGVIIDAGFLDTFIGAGNVFSDNGGGLPGGATDGHDIDSSEASTQIAIKPFNVLDAVNRNITLFEHSRGNHGWQGNVYYVDPISGNDNHEGTIRNPFATFGAAHAAATDGNHDLILLVSTGVVGIVEMDEQITITKNNILVRGPGGGFRWKSSISGDVITVAASGVELGGFSIEGHSVGSGRCLSLMGDGFLARDLFFERSGGDAVYVSESSNGIVERCTFKGRSGAPSPNITGNGVTIFGTSAASYTRIRDCFFMGVGGDGVAVTAAVNDTMVCKNVFHDGAGVGVNIAAGPNGTIVHQNQFSFNAGGRWTNLGTDTTFENNEQQAKETTARLAVALIAAS